MLKRPQTRITVATVTAVVSTIVLAGGHGEPAERSAPPARISAPIHYADTMLAFVDDEGVALVVFQCPATRNADVITTSKPVRYRFRYQTKGMAVMTGTGLLFEKYKPDGERKFVVVNDGGQLRISAGHFQVEWSEGDADMGWLYYNPEDIRVQLANAKQFETINLERFRH